MHRWQCTQSIIERSLSAAGHSQTETLQNLPVACDLTMPVWQSSGWCDHERDIAFAEVPLQHRAFFSTGALIIKAMHVICVRCRTCQHPYSIQVLLACERPLCFKNQDTLLPTCSAHVYCGLLGGGTSTQATTIRAAGVMTEGRLGDAPPAGLCNEAGELTGTAPGAPEVGEAGVPGVTGVEVVPGVAPVGEAGVDPVGAGVVVGEGGVTVGVPAVGAGVPGDPAVSEGLVPGVPAVGAGVVPGVALVGAGVAVGRVTVGVPGVGAGVVPGFPAVGEGVAAWGGGTPLTVVAGEEPA